MEGLGERAKKIQNHGIHSDYTRVDSPVRTIYSQLILYMAQIDSEYYTHTTDIIGTDGRMHMSHGTHLNESRHTFRPL